MVIVTWWSESSLMNSMCTSFKVSLEGLFFCDATCQGKVGHRCPKQWSAAPMILSKLTVEACSDSFF
eukprot:4819039-Amphidinium_carterae.1